MKSLKFNLMPHLLLDDINRANGLQTRLFRFPFNLREFLLLWFLLLLLWLLLLHSLELLLDARRCLYGHHVLDLVGLDWPPRLLDLDGQLQFDLLGYGAALLLGLDLGLDLSGDVGR